MQAGLHILWLSLQRFGIGAGIILIGAFLLYVLLVLGIVAGQTITAFGQ